MDLPIIELNLNKFKKLKYLGEIFYILKTPIFIRGSYIYSNTPFDIDLIIINEDYIELYLRNIINIFYPKIKNDILFLKKIDLEDNYFRFLIKHKSYPLNLYAKNITDNINKFTFSNFPKKKLYIVNEYLKNFNYYHLKNYIFIAKLIIRALYEKYIIKINKWLIDLKVIYIELNKIKLEPNEKKLLEISNYILKSKTNYIFEYNKQKINY